MQHFVRLPSGRTRAVSTAPGARVGWLQQHLQHVEGVPVAAQRLVAASKDLQSDTTLTELCGLTIQLHLRVNGGGGDGDQPDWTERGKISNRSKAAHGTRAPDWHADPKKYDAHIERGKRDRGELVIALGPFCVPCGKRFAKQGPYDAHLSGAKHLKALQKLGRTEEAMVCQLDVEAKRRKIAEFEDARDAAGRVATRADIDAQREDKQEAEQRRVDREAKLRERAMIAMPSTVAASSVYEDDDGEAPSLKVAPEVVFDPLAAAAAASGVKGSMTSGMQDGLDRTNRFTTTELAATHRALAVPDSSFFAPGIHAEQVDEEGTAAGPMLPPPPPQ